MNYIYHIVKPTWWGTFKNKDLYVSETLDQEGFIHCSTETQLLPTCNRHFKGIDELVILKLDISKLTSKLIFELAPNVGEEFPHIYGPINLDAVIEIKKLIRNQENTFEFLT
ncbi:MAG: DUF952 domain-containing protein [Bacteroidetes bacterium]|nr:DUF952 domain-containing protein [Bacteroidota bacterium]